MSRRHRTFIAVGIDRFTRDRLAGLHQQKDEDCALFRAPKVEQPSSVLHFERSQDPKLHASDRDALYKAGAEAIYPPGTVISDAAEELIHKLNTRLGHSEAAE